MTETTWQSVAMWLKFMVSLDLVENAERILENKMWPKRYLCCLDYVLMKKKAQELGVMEC